MTVPVTLIQKHEAQSTPYLTNRDTTQELKSFDPDTVCRTCTKQNSRQWAYGGNKAVEAILSGMTEEEMTCSSDKVSTSFRVLESTDVRNQTVPLGLSSSKRTVSIVDSCGQSVMPKCKNCDRFVPLQVKVPYDPSGGKIVHQVKTTNSGTAIVAVKEDGTAPYWWKVTIGGHCSIPKEGIEVDGDIKFCDPKQRKYKVENPSCNNCYYLWRPNENWMFNHLEVNFAAALNPWEREQAQEQYEHMDNPAAAYGIALYQKQTVPYGRVVWYGVDLLDIGVTEKGNMYYAVRFHDSRLKAKLSATSSKWTVWGAPSLEEWEANKAKYIGMTLSVEILYPHMKKFGLGMPKYYAAFQWPEMPKKIRVQHPMAEILADPDCNNCRKKPSPKACYYHSKDPRYKVTTDEVVFRNPGGTPSIVRYPAHGTLEVEEVGDKFVVLDGNGNRPTTYGTDVANATVFRVLRSKLIEQARTMGGEEAVQQVLAQYKSVVSQLRRGKPRTTRPSWIRPNGMDPSRPTCSHPYGLDLRWQFQDAFGSERADWNFDHGLMVKMEVAEEQRVGKRQHNQTPQKLHEEVMSNIISNPNYNPVLDEVPKRLFEFKATPFITIIDAIGGMTDEFGSPVTDTSEFLDRLSEEVIVGYVGDQPRMMSKRRQMFGYDMTRGYYGKRRGHEKIANPSLDSDTVIFEKDQIDLEQSEFHDNWECPTCNTQYTATEVDPYWLVCEECGSDLYRDHSTRTSHNPRRSGGVGVAIVADSPRQLERRRLDDFVCPNWRLNTSKIITLQDVDLPGMRDLEETGNKHVDKVEKFLVSGNFTPEMEAANLEYEAKMAKVVNLRHNYLEKFPETSAAELHRLFPTPSGKVYVRRAAGSLSKMGGV